MSKEWKIYTKTGDKGTTALIGGTRVPKYHPRIEVYGTVDELNAFVGLLRDQVIDKHSRQVLIEIQERLFTLESLVAHDAGTMVTNLPILSDADVTLLEKEMDDMNDTLPPLTAFILPGGHPVVSYAHICRTITRRAERLLIKLSIDNEVDEINIKYLNRLSDYFFVLGRKLAMDFNAREIVWKPRH
jgi:cob(I)alamin adenosyltransferase